MLDVLILIKNFVINFALENVIFLCVNVIFPVIVTKNVACTHFVLVKLEFSFHAIILFLHELFLNERPKQNSENLVNVSEID